MGIPEVLGQAKYLSVAPYGEGLHFVERNIRVGRLNPQEARYWVKMTGSTLYLRIEGRD